jgi:DNA-directed RNA polymerase sigma subunit (sigma70/sigma32)
MVDREKRRIAKATDERATEMYRLRTQDKLSMAKIGQRYNRTPERVRQILKRYCHTKGLPYPARIKR